MYHLGTFMEALNQLFNQVFTNINNSPYPALYYIMGILAIAILIYLINKLIKIFIFFVVICIFMFGLNMAQGKDLNQIMQMIVSYAEQAYNWGKQELNSGVSSFTNGNSIGQEVKDKVKEGVDNATEK